jgi:hypothetical protein
MAATDFRDLASRAKCGDGSTPKAPKKPAATAPKTVPKRPAAKKPDPVTPHNGASLKDSPPGTPEPTAKPKSATRKGHWEAITFHGKTQQVWVEDKS